MSFTAAIVPAQLFRVSRSPDPLALTPWTYLASGTPGRWDDERSEFRTLYTATNVRGALAEVLQDMRPRAEAERIVRDVDAGGARGTMAALDDAVMDRLGGRYIGEISPTDGSQRVVNVDTPASRTRLEALAGVGMLSSFGITRIKRGDFTSSRTAFTRLVARIVFDERHAGLTAPSAEYAVTRCYAFFETSRETGKLRALLAARSSAAASDKRYRADVRAVIAYLGGAALA